MKRTRVALVLGGGGARGFAHIGVIGELLRRDVDIVGIGGTSMGALVGGLYAAGALPQFETWAAALTQRDVLRLIDPSLTAPGGMVRAERLLDFVRELLGTTLVEQLPIPFTAVATDLITGRPVWLQHGRLDDAIRASIAIPGVITPHTVGGRLLADGGILDPLPLATVNHVDADIVIGVDVGADSAADRVRLRANAESRPVEELVDRLRRSTNQLMDTEFVRTVRDRFRPVESEQAVEIPGVATQSELRLNQIEVLNRALELMQTSLTRLRISADPPDLLIEVPRGTARALDFHRAAELIAGGRERAIAALDSSGYPDLVQPV
ncbi:patatin-like phospholipase family protein [Nocardia stercoris]|uniref:patatin-like phospholipase family protein n=1 Tax=Nocardia stercoris TaxID=2483361 RepID=UPI001F424406|nr:patatin-like phospholipase family protein [Nocardia stercoris]